MYLIVFRNTLLFLSFHILGGLYGYYNQNVICNTFINTGLLALRSVFFSSLPYLLVTFIGFLWLIWRIPSKIHHSNTVLTSITIYFRYVTKGRNPQLIYRNVEILLKLFEKFGFNKYVIEVVTDFSMELPIDEKGQVLQILVPENYEISYNGSPTKFKARALQYALENSQAQNLDYIVHLDEETLFDQEFLFELVDLLKKHHENPKVNSEINSEINPEVNPEVKPGFIAQGCIKYYQPGMKFVSWQHLFTTLADCLRVSDDHARFQFQFYFQKCWFGMKGSFIVIQNALEKQIGFNHGYNASITEDTFFAFKAAHQKIPFHYMESCMYEKSPFTFKDFLYQRRRWFNGLWKVSQSSEQIHWFYRYTLKLMLLSWILSPASWAIMVWSFLTCAHYVNAVEVILGIMLGSYIHIYVHGFVEQFSFVQEPLKYLSLLILTILCMPLFSILETVSVLFAILKPPQGFFVVQKST